MPNMKAVHQHLADQAEAHARTHKQAKEAAARAAAIAAAEASNGDLTPDQLRGLAAEPGA